MKVGDIVWLVSHGQVVQRYTQGLIVRETSRQMVVSRADRNRTQKFDKATLHSVPYNEGYHLRAGRPDDADRMQPSVGQRRIDAENMA